MENQKQITRRFSYVIRTPDKTYFTLPEQTLNKTLKRTEYALVQLASQGKLSVEDVGTRIADCRRFINDIKERDEQNAKDRTTATWERKRKVSTTPIRLEGESDADFAKRKHAHYAYESWKRKRNAAKEKKEALCHQDNTP